MSKIQKIKSVIQDPSRIEGGIITILLIFAFFAGIMCFQIAFNGGY